MQSSKIKPLRFYAEAVVVFAVMGVLFCLHAERTGDYFFASSSCQSQIDYVRNAPLDCAKKKIEPLAPQG